MEALQTSVLGIYTFDVFYKEPFQHKGKLKVFDGRNWIVSKSKDEAEYILRDILQSRYDNSVRATPTGFGFVADSKTGFVIGELFGRHGIRPAKYAKFHYYDDGWKSEAQDRDFHYTEFGLSQEKIEKDMQEMNRACGY